MTPADAALIVGATARLTRLVVADDIGQWMLKDPLSEIAATHADQHGGVAPSWWRYVDGLSCPFCWGFWAGVIVLGSHAATEGHPKARAGWRFVTGALTLNYVAAHIGVRLGDTVTESE